ncbi:MAG TPA: hypothetical protein VMY39_06040, partial [Planctomycetota bacterium]|nr:hypothetical protein [Planctomycetota bacterium]
MSVPGLALGELRVDVSDGKVTFNRAGNRLPWEIDLAPTTGLVVRPHASGASEESVSVRPADLTLRRLSTTHLQ